MITREATRKGTQFVEVVEKNSRALTSVGNSFRSASGERVSLGFWLLFGAGSFFWDGMVEEEARTSVWGEGP